MYDLTGREWAAIVPLLALMVWMGTFTQSFMPPISAQNARILEQTQKLKVERVENKGPGDSGPGKSRSLAPLGMTPGIGSAKPAKIEVARAR
jgi:hypothetical protein